MAERPVPPLSPDSLAALQRQVTDALRAGALDLELSVALLLETSRDEVDADRLLAAARDGWALGAQLSPAPQGWRLRISAVAPGSPLLVTHQLTVSKDDIELRTITLLKQLTQASSAALAKNLPPPGPEAETEQVSSGRLTGRAILAAYGATAGGYFGYAINGFGGASDSGLVFPLMTLGAGAGLGAALVAAEEWDIDETDARYLWAVGMWPTIGTLFFTRGLGDDDQVDHGWGLAATGMGLTLGAMNLTAGDLKTGGDALTHSGAVYGALLGGLMQLIAEGSTDVIPNVGMGAGMLGGVALAGGAAPWLPELELSRVMFADLSASLGAMAGAAVASPLLVGRARTPLENRLWLSSTVLGALTGGILGFVLTGEDKSSNTSGGWQLPVVHLEVGQRPGILPGTTYPTAELSGRF